MPFAYIKLIDVMLSMPIFMRDLLLGDYTEKLTFVYSNVPGFRAPMLIAGKACNAIGFFVVGIKSVMGAFTVISTMDRVKIGVIMDK